MDWIDEIASDDVLRQAYDWLCERRVDYSPNDDVWDVGWRWKQLPRPPGRVASGRLPNEFGAAILERG